MNMDPIGMEHSLVLSVFSTFILQTNLLAVSTMPVFY